MTDAIATTDRERTLELDDGSRLVLEPGSRLAPLENTGRSIALLLKTGRVHFDVQPGGPRRWSIEGGLATVEVIGTSFVVSRSPSQVTIEVERGTVLVRGERVVNRAQRLQAGDRLDIAQEVVPAASSPVRAAPPTEPGSERNHKNRHEPVWRDLARRGDYEQAYQNLGAGGIATQVQAADIDQLLALADVARLSGHPSEAVEPLRRVVREFGSEERGPLAAFTLGRVHLDSLDDPRAAARDFRDAISLGLSSALLEDAYLRLIESSARAGDRGGTEQSCQAHRQRFPDSSRRATAAQWCPR